MSKLSAFFDKKSKKKTFKLSTLLATVIPEKENEVVEPVEEAGDVPVVTEDLAEWTEAPEETKAEIAPCLASKIGMVEGHVVKRREDEKRLNAKWKAEMEAAEAENAKAAETKEVTAAPSPAPKPPDKPESAPRWVPAHRRRRNEGPTIDLSSDPDLHSAVKLVQATKQQFKQSEKANKKKKQQQEQKENSFKQSDTEQLEPVEKSTVIKKSTVVLDLLNSLSIILTTQENNPNLVPDESLIRSKFNNRRKRSITTA